MRVLLVGCYELGHQPLTVAHPAAVLARAGHEVVACDLAVEEWDQDRARRADAIAFSVPMHTATRIALEVARTLRAGDARVPIALYGLYAGMAADEAATVGVDVLPGGDADALTAWIEGKGLAAAPDRLPRSRSLGVVPDRSVLPSLERYVALDHDGRRVPAGSTAASAGCRHRCRHCPVPVVWDGRIQATPIDAVVADVSQQVEAGIGHLSFTDPDFLNAPAHALRAAHSVHRAHPELSWDCTVKVEHIIKHERLWCELADAGLLFVVSAVETLDDQVLQLLDKGHTAADVARAVEILRRHGIELRPSLLPFTPWTTASSLARMLQWVASCDLIGNVDPVQYTVRLLVPPGSLLLARPELSEHMTRFDPAALSHQWAHPDPRLDELQAALATLVEDATAAGVAGPDVFADIWRTVDTVAGGLGPPPRVPDSAYSRPRLTESWFCCSEPTSRQLDGARVGRT